jgi:branched-chain amino acid transport system substrate-binding protein
MRRTFLFLAGLSAIAVLTLGLATAGGGLAATSGDAGKAAKQPIIIGAAVARSGFFATFDVAVSNGAEIQVAKINARGGVLGRPLKIVYSDTKSDINQSRSAALDVISKGAVAVITSCDYDLGGPAARAAGEKNLVAFSCAGSPRFGYTAVGPLAFSISNGTPTQGAIAADFAYSRGWHTAYLLDDISFEYNKTWCDYFAQRFKELHGKIVGKDTFQQADTSFQTQVTRLRGQSPKPSVVAMCSFPPGGATAIRQMRSAGIKIPIIGTAGFDGPFWLPAVPGANDIYSAADASLYGDDPNPAVNAFFKAYKAKTGQASPTSYPIYGPSMVAAIAAGIAKAGTTDGKAVARAIGNFKNQPLLVGPTSYTQTCHQARGRPMRIIQYKKGKGSFLRMVKPGKVAKVAC